jgi:hypothetical protein
VGWGLIAGASAILLEAFIQVGAKLAASPGRVPGFLREGAGMLRGGKLSVGWLVDYRQHLIDKAI